MKRSPIPQTKKLFAKYFARNHEKKIILWNIRLLVDDSFVPSSQRPSLNILEIDGFVASLVNLSFNVSTYSVGRMG